LKAVETLKKERNGEQASYCYTGKNRADSQKRESCVQLREAALQIEGVSELYIKTSVYHLCIGKHIVALVLASLKQKIELNVGPIF